MLFGRKHQVVFVVNNMDLKEDQFKHWEIHTEKSQKTFLELLVGSQMSSSAQRNVSERGLNSRNVCVKIRQTIAEFPVV